MNYHKSLATRFYCTNIYCTVYTRTYGTYARGIYMFIVRAFTFLWMWMFFFFLESEFMFVFGNILMHFYYNICSNKFLLSPDQGKSKNCGKT